MQKRNLSIAFNLYFATQREQVDVSTVVPFALVGSKATFSDLGNAPSGEF